MIGGELSRIGGSVLLESAADTRRGSGPVRVSYFDPRTGEPCDEKPEPLKRKAARKTPRQLSEERAAAEREGAEIAERMAARRAKPRKRAESGRSKKPVVVDGVRYASQAEASAATGIARSTLSRKSAQGAAVDSSRLRGRKPVLVDGVRYASIAEAAMAIGARAKWLGDCLRRGIPCKGREVRYADEEDS